MISFYQGILRKAVVPATWFSNTPFGGFTTEAGYDRNRASDFAGASLSESFLGYDFGTPTLVTSFDYASSETNGQDTSNSMRTRNLRFQASNDFVNWVTLYTTSTEAYFIGRRRCTFANATPYRYYRAFGGEYCQLAELWIGSVETLTENVYFAVPPFGTGFTIRNGFSLSSDRYASLQMNGGYIGQEFSTPKRLASFSVASSTGSRLQGAKVQGSNDLVNWTDLYTLPASGLASNTTYSYNITDTTQYRYVRYLGPNGSYCDIYYLNFVTA